MASPSSSLKVVVDKMVGEKVENEGAWIKDTYPWNVPVAVNDVFEKQTFNWASNADIAAAAVLLQTAEWSFPNSGYGKAVRGVMDYLFGLNPIGKSFVTGYGANPARNPHHRFWAKHANINFPPAPPGLLVGGPNGKWSGSLLGADFAKPESDGGAYYMQRVVPSCNPLDKAWVNGNPMEDPRPGGIACYMDDIRLYMTNEVAINWNAPLFWLSAFVN